MRDSNVNRWVLALALSMVWMAGRGASAQTASSAGNIEQERKLAAEAAQQPDAGTPAQTRMLTAKIMAESTLAGMQQPELSSEERLQAKKEKERAEMQLTIDASSRLIKDKPYSAQAVTETIQVLADGNRIVHHWQNRFYRDTNGRTRREQTLGALQANNEKPAEVHIFIYNPIAKTDYILDPGSKTARKLVYNREPMVMLLNDAERFGQVAQMPPLDESRDITTEELGSKTIEGLQCTGKRTTYTIPAGLQGNERPIIITLENWYSKNIEATVESITNDPRSGETHYKLEHVERGEQPLSLFEPSVEYKLESR